MDEHGLYLRIEDLLRREEKGTGVDYKAIQEESLDIIRLIATHHLDLDDALHQYLDDCDIRKRDRKYRDYQLRRTRAALDAVRGGDKA